MNENLTPADVRNAILSFAPSLGITEMAKKSGYSESALRRRIDAVGGPRSIVRCLDLVAESLGVPLSELVREAERRRDKRITKGERG